MLRKIAVVLMIGAAVTFSPVASALADKALEISEASNGLVVLAQNDVDRSMQVAQNKSRATDEHYTAGEDKLSLGTAGWLSVFALLGFIALSNRRML